MRKNKEIKDNQVQSRSVKRTKTALRKSLIELMRSRSILRITVKDICDHADVGRSTFYAHYDDQYDLLQQIQEETIVYLEKILERYFKKESKIDYKKMITELLNYVADNSNSIQVLLSENGDTNFQKKIFGFIRQKQILDIFSEKFNKKMSEYVSVYSINGAIGAIQQWIKNKMDVPVSDMAELFVKLAQGKVK